MTTMVRTHACEGVVTLHAARNKTHDVGEVHGKLFADKADTVVLFMGGG